MTSTVVTGLSGAVGGRFIPATGQIVFVERGGRLAAADPATGVVSDLASDYQDPRDVVAVADWSRLIVGEAGGTLWAVDPLVADRADAREIANGLGALHQLALTPDGAAVLAVEADTPGRLIRVDLATGAVAVVTSGLDSPVGLALDLAGTTAYVTEQAAGRLTAVDLASGTATELLPGLSGPAYLGWAGATTLVVADQAANEALLVDVATAAASLLTGTNDTPVCPTVVATGATTTVALLCDTEIVTEDVPTQPQPGCRLQKPAAPLYVGGYVRLPYELTGGLTPDDVTFAVPDGPVAGAISPSRDATWDPARPHVMLLGGTVPGSYRLDAVETATGTVLDSVGFDLTAEWADQDAGPAIAFTGVSETWVTGGAWGGGGPGLQNVATIPAAGTRRIAIVLVDTSDSRYPTTGTTTAGHRTRWANELLGTTAEADGVFRSVHHYFQEVSETRFDVSLVGSAVAGPVQLPGGWQDYFDWNTDRSVWWANGNYFQAVVTAAQDVVDFTQVDTLVAVMNSLTTAVQTGTTLFSWPVAGGGNVSFHQPGQTTTQQRTLRALNMPVDWETADSSGRRIHETLSHEIGHNLGLGDLYMNITGFDPAIQARDVGSWDLMSWENPLPHLTVPAKLMLGWIDPATVRPYNFALNGGGVDDPVTLQASSALALPLPAGRSAAIEVRRADGWNYYFEYRRGQGGDIGDRQLPTDGAVFGTDVVSGTFTPPQSRRAIVELINDVDGDGPILFPGQDYEEDDPTGPAHFSLDVVSVAADSAQVRVRYGAGGRPDPSIRPWPGGNVWQSPDIEIRNAKSDKDSAWLNVPWAGHTNRVVAKVTNSGDFLAKAVRVGLSVKDFAIGGAPESPLSTVVHDVPAGATVEFETTWTPPANTPTSGAHYCIVARIALYQDPGNPAIVELTELNNVAQSNYTRFISSSASPSSREISHVTLHNPYPERTRMWVVAQQDSDFYRTYLEHQWLWLEPGESRRVGVMVESLVGDPAFAALVDEHFEEILRRPGRLALVGLLENPLDEQLHTADASGGASIETASGRATRIDPFDVGGGDVRGRVVLVPTGDPVTDGVVIITAQPRGRSEGEIDIATAVDLEGNFAAPLRLPDRSGETWVVQAEYLGAIGFGNCAGPRVRVVT